MKKLLATLLFLFLLNPLLATDYYVDTAADPGGDGTTQATSGGSCAWDAIADVNGASLSAGDSVLFKRGCTWRERLTPPDSGSDGSLITFGTYGEGADPLIMGSSDLSGASWTEYIPEWVAQFEGDNLSEFDAEDDAGTDLTTTDAEKHGGTYSMIDVIDDTTVAYVTQSSDLAGKEIKFSFWIKLSSVASGDWGTANQQITIVQNTTNPNQRYVIYIRHTGAAVQTYSSFDAAGANDNYGYVELITDTNWHKFEVHLNYDTGGAGYHKLWFDTVQKHNSTGLTCSVDTTTGMNFGDPAIHASWDGDVSIYWDDFVDESVESAENVWYNDDLAADPTVIWLDGTSYPEAADAVSVDATDRWFWEAGETRIHVYATESPTTFYSTIEAPTDDYACQISNKSYLEFEDIHFKYAIVIVAYLNNGTDHVEFNDCTLEGAGENCTLCFSDADTEYNTFDNCLIYGDNITEINQTVWGADSGPNYMTFKNCTIRNGTHSTFQITSGNNWVVENCEIYSSSGFGRCLAITGSSGEGSNIIRYNYIHDSYNGDYTASGDNQVNGEGNQIYYNIFSGGEGHGLRIYKTAPSVCIDNVFYNNVFYGFTGAGVYVSVSDGADSGNLFKNNIFMENDSDNHYQVEYRVEGGLVLATFENNCIYDSATASTVYDFGTARTVAYMETNHGTYWGSNIISDPKCIDAASDNFRLIMGSPCRNAGADVSLTTDYRGRSIRHAPDIGAYEDPTSALFLTKLFKYLKEKRNGKQQTDR